MMRRRTRLYSATNSPRHLIFHACIRRKTCRLKWQTPAPAPGRPTGIWPIVVRAIASLFVFITPAIKHLAERDDIQVFLNHLHARLDLCEVQREQCLRRFARGFIGHIIVHRQPREHVNRMDPPPRQGDLGLGVGDQAHRVDRSPAALGFQPLSELQRRVAKVGCGPGEVLLGGTDQIKEFTFVFVHK